MNTKLATQDNTAANGAVLPSWTYEGKTPSVYTFFEAVALADMEGRPVRLSAALQRALLGSVVFGRREVVVHGNGTVECTVSVSFGQDFETATWSARTVQLAAQANKQLRPGTTGRKYFHQGKHKEHA